MKLDTGKTGKLTDSIVIINYCSFYRAALRMASSILEKVAEGLSPSMTSMLVKEKEVW